jgi:predicted nucleic acid-binding protein
MSVFLDTYALIELFAGNPKFARFKDDAFTITVFNLVEFYYCSLVEKGERQAQDWYEHLSQNLTPLLDDAIFEAMEFRIRHRKLNLSYADAIGYIAARRLGLQFVTGDESFKSLPNVIFIKK